MHLQTVGSLYDLCMLHFESYCMWCFEWINSTTGYVWNHPDISIMLLYTFYQPVFYATHDQHLPSESEERAAFCIGFGEYCVDAMTHKLLDKITQEIIYRSAVQPITTANPNHRLNIGGGESEASTGSIKGSKAQSSKVIDQDRMMLIHPCSILCLNSILMIWLERLRTKVAKKVVEENKAADGNRIPNMNFILNIGEGKVEELITYNQLLDHLEQAEEQDNSMDQELFDTIFTTKLGLSQSLMVQEGTHNLNVSLKGYPNKEIVGFVWSESSQNTTNHTISTPKRRFILIPNRPRTNLPL